MTWLLLLGHCGNMAISSALKKVRAGPCGDSRGVGLGVRGSRSPFYSRALAGKAEEQEWMVSKNLTYQGRCSLLIIIYITRIWELTR